jgi:hypothetical protein
MKKARLLISILAIGLIICAGTIAQAAVIGFSGPYQTRTNPEGELVVITPSGDILAADVPDVMICEWWDLGSYGIPIDPPDGVPAGTLSWLLHAGEDLPDFEFESDFIRIEPGAHYPDPAQAFYANVDWDPANPLYMHFNDGVIPLCTYFDIHYYEQEFDLEGIRYHATPIPGAVWLLGSGLVGLVGLRKKFRK